ncbi:hypothetical protein [Paenibacillus sp. FJAT-26967]|uniref:hypothetical protein n=1 Tax=Paenibacillus sp. FJAT-26967 TaxID=1729690 RepID=UPI000837B1A1|nr:hypothetical protein [Paenibacillus sp. FJAT-26967]
MSPVFLHRFHRSTIYFTVFVLLTLLANLTAVRTVTLTAENSVVVYAILFDFMLAIPVCYWLFILRRKGKSVLKALPLTFIGALAAWFILPVSLRSTAWDIIWPIEFLIIFVEVLFVGYEIRVVYRVVKHFRQVIKTEPDRGEALRITVKEKLGQGKLASLLLHDATMVYYLCFSWRRRKTSAPIESGNSFTYHRTTGQILHAAIFTKILLIESVVIHLLIQQWSHMAAWILTLANLWLLLLLWADCRVSVLRPVQITKGVLRLRYGLRIQADIPLCDIESAESAREYAPDSKEQRDAVLPVLATANVRLRLSRPASAQCLLFMPRHVSSIYLALDEPDLFIRQLHEKMSEQAVSD